MSWKTKSHRVTESPSQELMNHEGTKDTKEEEGWAISSQIYPVIFSENARVFNILAQ